MMLEKRVNATPTELEASGSPLEADEDHKNN